MRRTAGLLSIVIAQAACAPQPVEAPVAKAPPATAAAPAAVTAAAQSGCGGLIPGEPSAPEAQAALEIEAGCAVQASRATLEQVIVSAPGGARFGLSVEDLALSAYPAKKGNLARVTVLSPLRFQGVATVPEYRIAKAFDAAGGVLHVAPGSVASEVLPKGATATATIVLGQGGPVIEEVSLSCEALTIPGSGGEWPQAAEQKVSWRFERPATMDEAESLPPVVFWAKPGEGDKLTVNIDGTSFEKLGQTGAFTQLSRRMENGSALSGWVENAKLTDKFWGDLTGNLFSACGESKSGLGEGDKGDVNGWVELPVGAKIAAAPGGAPWAEVTKALRSAAVLRAAKGAVQVLAIAGIVEDRNKDFLEHAFARPDEVSFHPGAMPR